MCNDFNVKCTYNVALRGVRVTIFAMGKAINIAYSEFVFVNLFIIYAKRMHRIIYQQPDRLCHIFPRYLKTGTLFEKIYIYMY